MANGVPWPIALGLIGGGIYSGRPGAGFAQLGQLQQAQQQLLADQAFREQQMAQQQEEFAAQQEQRERQFGLQERGVLLREQQFQADQQARAEAQAREEQRRKELTVAAQAMVNPLTFNLAPQIAEQRAAALSQLAAVSPETVIAGGMDDLLKLPPGMEPPEPPKLTDISGMRKEFTGQSKEWQSARDAFERMEASQPTGPGDVNLLISYMKMLDPTSVVQPGELATADNASGVSERFRGFYNRIAEGERLTPVMRARFLNQGAALLKAQRDQQLARESTYKGIAQRTAMPVEDAVPDLLGRYREEIPSFGSPEQKAQQTIPKIQLTGAADNIMKRYLGGP